MRALMSAPIADSLVCVDVVAPVMLVDSLVAPIVLEGEVLGDVSVELLGIVRSVDAARDGSVELLDVLVESGVDVAVLELGAEDTPYVELVPDGEVELGLVDAVVFRLPLVVSVVVLWVDRS